MQEPRIIYKKAEPSLADGIVHDHLHWQVFATVEKFRVGEDKPYEVVKQKGNLLLNEGIQKMLDLLTGTGGTSYNATNARIGVGNGSAAAAATQTALQGGSSIFVAMGGTYPSRASQTVSFQGTFGSGTAEFSWEEWSIDNGSTGTLNLNRKVGNLGTKGTNETWVLTADITVS